MSHTHKMVEFVACALCAMVAVSGAQAGLTLTPTGIADGFSLSVFATGFPHNTSQKYLKFSDQAIWLSLSVG
jgi:hypothetical protein